MNSAIFDNMITITRKTDKLMILHLSNRDFFDDYYDEIIAYLGPNT